MLYDFVSNNMLTVVNFKFEQNINYTYSKGTTRSYIDHVLCTSDLVNKITDCVIMSDLKVVQVIICQ